MVSNSVIYILPDDILQYQICTTCKKYLSCRPVKSYASGEVKCGRCAVDNDAGYASSFENVIENFLFPCVNRFEGCTQLLKYKEVSDHEKICIGTLYSCSICDEEKYQKNSILHLMNHYKRSHWKSFLKQPVFTIAEKEHQEYVYCDIKNSLFCMISVSLNYNMLQINVTAPKNISLKYRLGMFTAKEVPDINDKPVLLTNYKMTGIASDTLDLSAFKIDKKPKKLYFKVDLDVNVTVTKLSTNCCTDKTLQQELQILEEQQNEIIRNNKEIVKTFPKLYRNELFKKLCGEGYMRKYDVVNNKIIRDTFSNAVLVVSCDFCENFYACSGEQRDIVKCNYLLCGISLCGQCYSRGVTRCLKCYQPMQTCFRARHYHMLFYCKFDCKRLFSGWELLRHEETCEYNKYRYLSDKDNIQLYFGLENIPNSSFDRRNSILFERGKFSKPGSMFVVTRDNFRFILTFWCDKEKCNFRVYTACDKGTHFSLIKVCQNGQISEYRDRFSLPLDSLCTFFVVISKELNR